jgi:hypothetical protein
LTEKAASLQNIMQKQLRILFMATFLSSLFGCKNQNHKHRIIFPKEKFMTFQAALDDGKPLIGSIDIAYKNYDKKKAYPWCLKLAIGLDLDSCYENGLPKDNESKIANKLEDDLLTAIKEITTAHYIGHLFNDTFLDVYVYLDKPAEVYQYLQTQINKEGIVRGFGYEIKNDPSWLIVKKYFR